MSTMLNVADAPLYGSLVAISPTAGAPLSNAVLFHFTDADPNGSASDYTATVQWDTGIVETSTANPTDVQIVADSAGGFDVLGSHTYTAAGPVAFQVTVDDHGASVSGSATVAVADAAVTIATITPPANPVVGVPFSGPVATFTDANPFATAGNFTATITWGDGTVSTVTSAGGGITENGGTFTVNGAHTYLHTGTTTQLFTVTITSAGGASASQSAGLVKVADAPLTITALTPPTGVVEATPFNGTVATFTDGDPSATAADFTATVTWGDGAVDTITSAGGGITESGGTFAVNGSHTYTQAGTYPFTVSISDGAGTQVSQSGTATVVASPVNVTNSETITTVQGQFVANALIATFSNGTPGSVTNFTASVAWGDGTTSPGSITYNATTGLYGVVASKPNPYSTPGTATITVTIARNGSSVATIQSTAVVLAAQSAFTGPAGASLGTAWTNELGAILLNGNGQAVTSGNGVNLSTYNGSTALNVSVQVDVALTAGVASSAGVVARATSNGNGTAYLAQIASTGGNKPAYTAQINLVAANSPNGSGALRRLGTATLTGFNGSGTLTFQVVGNALKLYVNGILEVVVHNNTIAIAGLVGMRATNAAVSNLMASVVPPQTTTLPFSDSFTTTNGQLAPVWTEQAGAFTVQSQTATSFGTAVALATVNTPTPAADVHLAAQVTVNPIAGATAGLVARNSGTPDSNEYVGQVSFVRTNSIMATYTLQIALYRNGRLFVLGSKTMTVAAGAFTGQLQFEVVGNSLKLFLGGVLQIAVHSSSLTGAGLVGIRAAHGAISSFTVSPVTLVTQPLPFSDAFTSANGQLAPVWTEQAGAFTVQSGTATPFGSSPALATLNTPAPVADASLQVGITVNAATNANAGLVARSSGGLDKNEYLGTIGYTRSSGGQNVYAAQIVVYKNGARIVLASTTITVAGVLTGTLAFDVVGTTLTLSLTSPTGTQLLTLSKTDTRLSTGLVGIRGTGASFSDFSAQ
jgi:hypothetical protein